jgi:TolB-like protein
MSQDLKSPIDHGGLHADPLYLSALASLGQSVPQKLLAVPAKGSIAVLPFVNMSGDPEQEFFTDGLTEDIITDLSNAPGFFVIARNSTFAYKGKPTDVRQIAHDLGVKYILEGSARRSAQRLRINVQLIDASEGGNHVWAERFDRDLADIFAVQDEVTRRVVEAITGKLNANAISERYRPTNLEAYDLCVRSRKLWWQTKAANEEAMSLLQRAISLDPNYAEAHWPVALLHPCCWVSDSGACAAKSWKQFAVAYPRQSVPNYGQSLSLT